MLMGPLAAFVIVTLSDPPAFRLTAGLSSFTWSKTKLICSAVGIDVGILTSPPAAGGVLGFNLPKGVISAVSGSMYQYHSPSTRFQVLVTGILNGLSVNPGATMYISQ